MVLARLNFLVLRRLKVLGDLVDDEIEGFSIVERFVCYEARIGCEAGLGLVVQDIFGRRS